MRLDKFLSTATDMSRKDIKQLIKKKAVAVNGEAAARPEMQVSESDSVTVNGESVVYREFIYFILNKPQGVVSATEDKHYPTVTELVPQEYRHFGVFPVGRLDIATEGLLILTNDGELAYRLMNPTSEIPKTYLARIEGTLTEKDLNPIRSGVELDGYLTKKCKAHIVETNKAYTKVHITITEGKNRQVRRMFESIGRNVEFLKRVSIGNLKLTGLDRGEVRKLTENEIIYLKKPSFNLILK